MINSKYHRRLFYGKNKFNERRKKEFGVTMCNEEDSRGVVTLLKLKIGYIKYNIELYDK